MGKKTKVSKKQTIPRIKNVEMSIRYKDRMYHLETGYLHRVSTAQKVVDKLKKRGYSAQIFASPFGIIPVYVVYSTRSLPQVYKSPIHPSSLMR